MAVTRDIALKELHGRESNAMGMGKFDSTYFPGLTDPLRQWGRDDLLMHRRLKEGNLLGNSSSLNGQRDVLKEGQCLECGGMWANHLTACSLYRQRDLLRERGTTHGNWATQSEGAQRIKAAFEDCPNWASLKPGQKEALQLIATKISRILHGNPDERDHWCDLSGYADLAVAQIDATSGETSDNRQ